ncbi:mCG1036027 [Mus musculus]|nr:mCG1036027 [Mus musculus]
MMSCPKLWLSSAQLSSWLIHLTCCSAIQAGYTFMTVTYFCVLSSPNLKSFYWFSVWVAGCWRGFSVFYERSLAFVV